MRDNKRGTIEDRATEVLITVTVVETGAEAEAYDADAAKLAALTIGREAVEHAGIWGFDPTIRFAVAGEPVLVTTLRGLTR